MGSAVTDDRDDDYAAMRARAVLPQVNALPGSKHETTPAYRYRQVALGQYAAYMSWHIIGPFGVVTEKRIAIRNQALHESFEIVQYVRVGVLT